MFARLGVIRTRERFCSFSATLQEMLLLYSTDPEAFPLDAVQAQVIAEYCAETHEA